MTEQTLKPCPFCGYKAKISSFARGLTSIHCASPTCKIPLNIGAGYDSLEKAIEVWNTRAPSKDREFLIKLSFPNHTLDQLQEILVNLPYEVDTNMSNRDAYIALIIRKHLKENP